MGGIYLGLTFLLLAYLVYWLVQNDGAGTIGEQKGFLSMRDMEEKERQRYPGARRVVEAKGLRDGKWADGKREDASRLGPKRIPEHDYSADQSLKERPRSPGKVPTQK